MVSAACSGTPMTSLARLPETLVQFGCWQPDPPHRQHRVGRELVMLTAPAHYRAPLGVIAAAWLSPG
jgi:hypothetical protein